MLALNLETKLGNMLRCIWINHDTKKYKKWQPYIPCVLIKQIVIQSHATFKEIFFWLVLLFLLFTPE